MNDKLPWLSESYSIKNTKSLNRWRFDTLYAHATTFRQVAPTVAGELITMEAYLKRTIPLERENVVKYQTVCLLPYLITEKSDLNQIPADGLSSHSAALPPETFEETLEYIRERNNEEMRKMLNQHCGNRFVTTLTGIEDEVSYCLNYADQFVEPLPTEIEDTASKKHTKDLLSLRDNISDLREIVLDDQDDAKIALPTFKSLHDQIDKEIHTMKGDLRQLTQEERKAWRKVDPTIRENLEISEIEELRQGIMIGTTDFGQGRNAQAMWKTLSVMYRVERYAQFLRHALKLREALEHFIETAEQERIGLQ